MHFFNRELSWLEFNYRVLREGMRRELPLAERLRFLGIATDNFDEFCMVRFAGLKHRERTAPLERDPAGLTVTERLEHISRRLHELADLQARALNDEVLPRLATQGLPYVPPTRYTSLQRGTAASFFDSEVLPLLTPLRVSRGTAPEIPGRILHAAFLLRPLDDRAPNPLLTVEAGLFDEPLVAVTQIPANLPRILRLPRSSVSPFALLDDIVAAFGTALFPGYSVEGTLVFRLLRDADMPVDEDAGESFLYAMEDVLSQRERSVPACLWCQKSTGAEAILDHLKNVLGLSDRDVIATPGVLDPSTLQDLAGSAGTLTDKSQKQTWQPCYPSSLKRGEPLWDTVRERDLLIHVPYESFEPILGFIHDASRDPDVMAIKMTLYRTSGNPPIIDALVHAAQNGKQVTVFVEVKARFNEKRNIAWADRLERAGVIVIYGIKNLKVHAKLLLVIRRGPGGLQRYVHFSTGNYNEKTARLYSDLSLFTTDNSIAQDATFFFNMLSGYSALETMKDLSLAPVNLKERLIALIDREIAASTAAHPGLIVAKVNSLTHEEIITALYRASGAGVRVLLNVRGVCMLVPGLEEVSENITVRSIVGHYLEHARAVYFANNGRPEVYLSSADWMPRNLDRRVELMIPVKQTDLAMRIKGILDLCFADNQNAWELHRDGTWALVTPKAGEASLSAQRELQRLALEDSKNSHKDDFVVRRRQEPARKTPPKTDGTLWRGSLSIPRL